ncbi:MAG: DUF4127 family protein [Phascolarctobacterium sp.]
MLNNNYWYHKLAIGFICAASLLSPASASAKKLTFLYIPLDNRPVCLSYVQQTMEAVDCKIILPPEKYIASHEHRGNPDKLAEWLRTKAPKADATVISTDSLLYGGLVASRTHHISRQQLNQRLQLLRDLNKLLPLKLYAFSTIMRTPKASKGHVEPPYYDTLGPGLFAYGELLDKQDQGKLTAKDRVKLEELADSLPRPALKDWLSRRELNYKINVELTRLARNNKFHYLAIGKDDNAPLSTTHMEARRLSMTTFEMPASRLQILDGVDQLGLLLLVRAYNDAHGQRPAVHALYSPGVGPGTLPQFSDARLQDSVPQQITAAGAHVAASAKECDLILALNTPPDGVVKDSTADDNQYFASSANKKFVGELEQLLRANTPVSLADISYSNGGDNGFMDLLARSPAASRLAAYNGWNTADNAVGYAIAQGLLAPAMDAAHRSRLMRQRLIDDWYYQSNARRQVADELEKHNREDMKYELLEAQAPVLEYVTKKCQRMAQKYPWTKGSHFKLSFPWDRLFEVEVQLKK